ncbi:MAG TPA: disulfide bond formation protein DsbA, partial [Hyphomonas sp.]|nr:disulfide bond formation protein DsbA [Hyphomonas sp.]
MNFFSRRTALAAISALALVACGDTGADTSPAGGDAVTAGSELGHVKGAADAPVTLIEYASPTCPACKYWHDDIQPVV